MNNLATTLRVQGDLPAARELHELELTICRRVLGEEHPDTLTSMNNLAATLWAQGDWPAAHVLQEQVLTIRLRVLGEQHPSTISSAWNLFLATRQLRDTAASEQLLQDHLLPLLDDPSPPVNATLQFIRENLRKYLADVAAAPETPAANSQP